MSSFPHESERARFTVQELGQLNLTLRRDLVFSPQEFGGQRCFVVEDEANSRFYRIGVVEYTFVSLLDGKTTIQDAVRLTSTALPDCSLTEKDAAAICKWLVDTELARTNESARAERLTESADAWKRKRLRSHINPLTIRVPLLYPDRFFEYFSGISRWLCSRWFFGVWFAVIVLAIYRLSLQSDRIGAACEGILAPSNWFWLGLSWVGLKVIHEMGHGIVCKRYGGAVKEAGIVLVLLAPLAYVDVTTSWRFRSKWPRIFTAAAGMYMELLVAAIAAIVWTYSPVGLVRHIAFNVVTMASLTALFFNANPLMRFDGYYILADLLEIPNLYTNGRDVLLYWAKKYLLDVPVSLPNWTGWRRLVISVYGVGSLLWRITVTVGLVIASTTLFHGWGKILGATALGVWLGMPVCRFVVYLVRGKDAEQPKRLRFVALSLVLVTAGYLFLCHVPWPGATTAPAFVDHSPPTMVRVASPGFVDQLRVQNGDSVRRGDVLAVLRNEVLRRELSAADIELQQSAIRARLYQRDGQLAAHQAELRNAESLRKRLAERKRMVDELTVRAPRDGNVLGYGLNSFIGTYLQEGAVLLLIGLEQHKEIRVSIHQSDLDTFVAHTNKTVTANLSGGVRLKCTLDKLNPRASLETPHLSMAAPEGGPLAVRPRAEEDNSEPSDRVGYELLEPRFTGEIQLNPEQSVRVFAGQRGTVAIRPFDESVGTHLYRSVERWVLDTFQANQRILEKN